MFFFIYFLFNIDILRPLTIYWHTIDLNEFFLSACIHFGDHTIGQNLHIFAYFIIVCSLCGSTNSSTFLGSILYMCFSVPDKFAELTVQQLWPLQILTEWMKEMPWRYFRTECWKKQPPPGRFMFKEHLASWSYNEAVTSNTISTVASTVSS